MPAGSCNKCKAVWEFGPSDFCAFCGGRVNEPPSPKGKKGAPPPKVDAAPPRPWWEFR